MLVIDKRYRYRDCNFNTRFFFLILAQKIDTRLSVIDDYRVIAVRHGHKSKCQSETLCMLPNKFLTLNEPWAEDAYAMASSSTDGLADIPSPPLI